MLSNFEVGSVYRDHRGARYLAVQPEVLIHVLEGAVFEIRPSAAQRYREESDATVWELLRHWGLASRELDKITRRYFGPQESARERKRDRAAEDVANIILGRSRSRRPE